MAKKKQPETIVQFIDALRIAYEGNYSLQIPYKIKNNEIVNMEFFNLLDYMGDNDPVTVKAKSKTELILEIQPSGIGKIIKAYENLQIEIKEELTQYGKQ